MFDKISERWAAKRSSRFKVFVDGKKAYEAFVQDHPAHFDEMSERHYRRARVDTRLRLAECAFTAAIELSEGEDALADAAVARFQLGLVRHICGELAEASELIHAALEVLSNLPRWNRAASMSSCHYHLGVIALKQWQLTDAVGELRRSRQMAEASADLGRMRSCDRALIACAAAGADIDTAYSNSISDDSIWGEVDNIVENPGPAFDEGDEIEREVRPRRVYYSQREFIFLASYSVEANDALMEHLNLLGDEFGRPISVSCVAFGSTNPMQRNLRQPEADQHLCATILVLEREGLKDQAFQGFVNSCVRRVAAVSDFRLLVYLHDLSMEELRNWADRDPLVAMLFDITQIDEAPCVAQLRRTLVPYVQRIEHIRAAAQWRESRLKLTRVCGNLAMLILVSAASLSLLGFPAWLLQSRLGWLGPNGPQLASLVLGTLAFPLQAPLIFMLLRGLRTTALAFRDNAAFMRWIFIDLLIMLGANHLQHTLNGPYSWLLLGLVVGVLLDSIRRAGRQAQRQLIDLESVMRLTTDPGMQDPKATVLRGDSLNPFSCPILPTLSARVFISYTLSSVRGSRLAAALHRGLERAGASPFVDRISISAGTSWRRVLNRYLGECDVFLCILDEKGVQRKWIAAELLAALEANRLTGTPEIVILLDPRCQRSEQPMLPVFRGVVAASAAPQVPGRPQILQLNARTQSSLVWALVPGRFMPTTVFTRVAALPIVCAIILLGFIGRLGIFGGFILGLLAILEAMGDFPLTSGLADRGWLEPVALLSAFWLGFTARAAIAWGYEREHGREMGMTIPTMATVGLVYACFLFLPSMSTLYVGWSAALAGAGWVMVASTMRMGVTDRRTPPRMPPESTWHRRS